MSVYFFYDGLLMNSWKTPWIWENQFSWLSSFSMLEGLLGESVFVSFYYNLVIKYKEMCSKNPFETIILSSILRKRSKIVIISHLNLSSNEHVSLSFKESHENLRF